MSASYHLAQVNVGRLVAPIDDPRIADFVSQLDAVNAIADSSPGFVWRLQDDAGNATSLRPFEDDSVLINMSVWESVDALMTFVYKSAHTAVLRRRLEWFQPYERHMALWWIPRGHIPDANEAQGRLDHLRLHGPTPFAFEFRTQFPPPA